MCGHYPSQLNNLLVSHNTHHSDAETAIQYIICSSIKKAPELSFKCSDMFWQRLMFPGSHPPSIFSAEKLNFCVRYGYRCDLLAIATKYDYTFLKVYVIQTNILCFSIEKRK